MTSRWIRNEPGARENAQAALMSAALAAGVGLTTFYFVRLLLAREPIHGREVGPSDGAQRAE